jgi:biopolymer transport protein ExbB/TolQ
MGQEKSKAPLCFFEMDIERRCGFSSSAGTFAHPWFAGVVAAVLTVALFSILMVVPRTYYSAIFLDRGPTQYAAVFLGFWCLVMLVVKRQKLKLQRRALAYDAIPSAHNFVLSSQTADQVVSKLHDNAADPERFIVYNRILIAISNLKNLGRVSDVDDMLRSISDRDESASETSFGLLNGFLWAIPVLGFIGTVLGLGESISRFSDVLQSQGDISGIVSSLTQVTAGLGTAFDTTLLSLVIALVLQLMVSVQKTNEERFLDDCSEYCMRQIVSRIKILPFEQSREI